MKGNMTEKGYFWKHNNRSISFVEYQFQEYCVFASQIRLGRSLYVLVIFWQTATRSGFFNKKSWRKITYNLRKIVENCELLHRYFSMISSIFRNTYSKESLSVTASELFCGYIHVNLPSQPLSDNLKLLDLNFMFI